MQQRPIHVKFINLILSLSDALELANPNLAQHQLRCGYILWEIYRALGITYENFPDIYIGALLHDVGALSPEDKLDVVNNTMDDTELHCILGETLLVQSAYFHNAAKVIRYHHEPYNLSRERNPSGGWQSFGAQAIHLADGIDRLIDRNRYILHQDLEIREMIQQNSGTDYDPVLVDAFLKASEREDFWLDLTSSRLYSILLNNGPCRNIEVSIDQLVGISKIFRDMIDFRSRFTAIHSSGVASAGAALAKVFGFSEMEINLMWVAGNLHDLGKMAVPNSILEKAGKLTREEFAVMRQHTYHTFIILNSIGDISHIAEWAAFHHERLDGTGYPFHVGKNEISTNARLMAVADIFTALSEKRPYRESMSKSKVMEILNERVRLGWLDGFVVNLLQTNYDQIHAETVKTQSEALAFFENEFTARRQSRSVKQLISTPYTDYTSAQ